MSITAMVNISDSRGIFAWSARMLRVFAMMMLGFHAALDRVQKGTDERLQDQDRGGDPSQSLCEKAAHTDTDYRDG